MKNNESIPANKKNWQKPDFWILDTYIQGGNGANVNEATGLSTSSNHVGKAGKPDVKVVKPGAGGGSSANWTAAHS